MELATERRGRFDHMEYLSEERAVLIYELPLAEVVVDFYDQLKSRTRGYASFDYDIVGFREGDLVKLDVLIAGEPVDAADRHRTAVGIRPGARARRASCARRSRASCSTFPSRRRSAPV